MNKKIIFLVIFACCALSLVLGNVYAQENSDKNDKKETRAAVKEAPAKSVETKELTKEESVAYLKNIFQYNTDVVQGINGLEVKQDASGASYMYKGKRLEELDKETLANILRSANNSLSLKRMQQTQKQLKNLKQIDDLNRTQRMLKQQSQSRAYTAPSVPKTTKAYTPPKTYKSPGK